MFGNMTKGHLLLTVRSQKNKQGQGNMTLQNEDGHILRDKSVSDRISIATCDGELAEAASALLQMSYRQTDIDQCHRIENDAESCAAVSLESEAAREDGVLQGHDNDNAKLGSNVNCVTQEVSRSEPSQIEQGEHKSSRPGEENWLSHDPSSSVISFRGSGRQKILECVAIALDIAKKVAQVHNSGNGGIVDITVKVNRRLCAKHVDDIFEYNITTKCRSQHFGNDGAVRGCFASVGSSSKRSAKTLHDEFSLPLGAGVQEDLHSLGLLFFQIFSGRHPDDFTSKTSDANASADEGTEMEIDRRMQTACNISSYPRLHDLPLTPNPSSCCFAECDGVKVPRSLSDLVSALLENETQSPECFSNADEVTEDLLQMLNDPDGFLFDSGTGGVFSVIKDIYGRTSETKILVDAYQRVCIAQTAMDDSLMALGEVVVISGMPGCGKTHLVKQIVPAVVESNGLFLHGKFDSQRKSQPYFAIGAAFEDFCLSIIRVDSSSSRQPSINSRERQELQAVIKEAVGSEAMVLAKLIPSLRRIVGETRKLPRLGALEIRNLFKHVFRKLVKAICASHPVVLFLDDLQWADPASLELLEILRADAENVPILIILSCRNQDEGYSGELHPTVSHLLQSSESSPVPTTMIAIKNLGLRCVCDLISDLLRMSRRLCRPLANILYRKTLGNPFFLIRLIRSLFLEGHLFFSLNAARWKWDERRIKTAYASDNVVAFLAQKIDTLAVETRQILMVMAACGSYINKSVLERVVKELNESPSEIGLSSVLSQAIDLGFFEHIETHCSLEGYTFSHDKIQQAAYSLIPDSDRQLFHRRIGSSILKMAMEEDLSNMLFLAVDQLNLGRSCSLSQNERTELAEVNYLASRQAKTASACVQAAAYAEIGMSLLPKECWNTDYPLSLQLHLMAAEMQYTIGTFDKLNDNLAKIYANGRSLTDTFHASMIQVASLFSQGKIKEAIDFGLTVAGRLDEPIRVDCDLTMAKEIIITKRMLFEERTIQLSSLPDMTDRAKEAAMEILSRVLFYSFKGGSQFVLLIACRMIQLSLRYGVCRFSSFAFTCYAAFMCVAFQDIEGGFKLGKESLFLATRYQDVAAGNCARTQSLYFFAVHPWIGNIALSLDPFSEAYQTGLNCGDVEIAVHAASRRIYALVQCGRSLLEIVSEAATMSTYMKEHHQMIALRDVMAIKQWASNLIGSPTDPLTVGTLVVDKNLFLEITTSGKELNFMCLVTYLQMTLSYFIHDYETAAKMGYESRNVDEILRYTFESCLHAFYFGLTAVAMARKQYLAQDRTKWLALAESSLKKITKWNQHAASNVSQKVYLLQAEIYSLEASRESAAMDCYKKAMDEACKNQFLQDEALAYERTAAFQLQIGQEATAISLRRVASDLYFKWGARAKATMLLKKW